MVIFHNYVDYQRVMAIELLGSNLKTPNAAIPDVTFFGMCAWHEGWTVVGQLHVHLHLPEIKHVS